MRTAESIEQNKAIAEITQNKGVSEHSAGLPANPQNTEKQAIRNADGRWKPGYCPNPGGRPKNDVAAMLAREVIEGSYEAAKAGLSAALSNGNAYTFKELADRGYGKLKEVQEITFKDTPDASLDERIAQLERDLGLVQVIDAELVTDLQPIGRRLAASAESANTELVAHESQSSDDAAKS